MFIVYLSLMQKGRVTQLQYMIKCSSPDTFFFPFQINTSYLPPPEKKEKVFEPALQRRKNKIEAQ